MAEKRDRDDDAQSDETTPKPSGPDEIKQDDKQDSSRYEHTIAR